MLRNYLAAALRNLVRNKLYATINIVGLAVGLTTVLLIALFVRDELSYDHWIPGYQRTYLITQIRSDMLGTPVRTGGLFFDLREQLAQALPSVDAVARVHGKTYVFRHGDVEARENVWWADADISRVIPFPVFAGDLTAALSRSDGMVITRSMARKYFGRDEVVGETIEIDHRFSMTVLAVLDDIPPNSNFPPLTILSTRSSFDPARNDNTFMRTIWTYYVRRKPGTSDQQFRKDFDAFIAQQTDPELVGPPGKPRTELVSLADLHFSPLFPPGIVKPNGSKSAVAAAAAIALVTLLMAVINFVNLTTAWAARRATEVGVRKVSGAERRHLIVQFIGETLLYVSLATAAAFAATWLLLPRLQEFMRRPETLPYLHEPSFLLGIAAFVIVLAFLVGTYPAFVLSAFRPAKVLKAGTILGPGSVSFRRVLTTVQFAVLIGLSLTVTTVRHQLHFAFNEGLRVPTDQVLVVEASCDNGNAFTDQVRALPGVSEVACSDRRALTTGTFLGSALILRDGTEVRVVKTAVGPGFFAFYGIRPLDGRLVPEQEGDELPFVQDVKQRGQPSVIVINEAAVGAFGFENAAAAIGQVVTIPTIDKKYQAQIVGVVTDFTLNSIGYVIPPTYYYADRSLYSALNVRITGHDIPETLASIDRLWKQFGEPRPITRSFLSQQLQEMVSDVTRQEQLFTAFTCVTVFIACLGLFGLSAFTAELRTKEIGVRKAMGASKADILKLILWEFAKPVLWANAIAWPVGYYAMHRWLQSFAYHVDLNPWIFLAAPALALLIAVITVSGHALLIARSQPVAALRYE